MTLDDLFAPFRPPLTNLVDRLQYWNAQQPEAIAFYYLNEGEQEDTLSYGELDRRARAIGGHLAARGMAGERVLLLYPPGLDFVCGFLGCLYAGAIAVPAYPPRRNRNQERILAISTDAQARVALTVRDVIDRIQGVLAETPRLNELTWVATDEVDRRSADEWKVPRLRDEALAVIQYTSGATGDPKGVMLSHANLMHNCGLITAAFEFSRSGCGMTWLPTYHDMGLLGGVLAPLYFGRPNVLMSPLAFLQKPIRWLRAISRYQVTVSGGPNFAYALCNEKITPDQCRGLNLQSWDVAFNGGEVIRAETLNEFSKRFAPYGFQAETPYPCYGMAETTLIVSGGEKGNLPVIRSFDAKALAEHRVVPVGSGASRSRCLVGCGKALTDQVLRVVEPDTNEPIRNGCVGEIWVRSPSVAQGYWNRPGETGQTFRAQLRDDSHDSFLKTGDLGFVLEDELFITGRLKDMIIFRGVNRYPDDIEQTVEHSSDQLCRQGSAAFAVEMDESERLIVVAEVKRGPYLHWDNVVAAVRRNVVKQHEVQLDAVILVRAGSIPKTSSSKIQRHTCRSWFLENSLTVVYQWQPSSGEPGNTQEAGVSRPRRQARL